MFAKWPIVAERASPGTMSTAGLTRPIAARLRQFGLRPPPFSGDAFPGCFWLTDGGSPSRCRAYFVAAFLTTASAAAEGSAAVVLWLLKRHGTLIFDLATAAFVGRREDALFLGPGGTCLAGKVSDLAR